MYVLGTTARLALAIHLAATTSQTRQRDVFRYSNTNQKADSTNLGSPSHDKRASVTELTISLCVVGVVRITICTTHTKARQNK